VWKVRGLVREKRRVVALDCSNAYNSLERSAMFAALSNFRDDDESLAPLKAYAWFVYGSTSYGWWQDGDGAFTAIASRRGVRQGCPAAPMLFCIALEPVLKRVCEECPGVTIVAYLDDITVCGPDALIDDAVNRLVAYCAELGLSLNREQDSAERPALRILGCAIAEDPTQAAALLHEIRPLGDYETFVSAIADVADDIQLGLLRSCGVSKAGFVARCHGAEATDWLASFDNLSASAMSRIAGCKQSAVANNPKVFLPIDLGGLGVTMWAPIAEVCATAARSQTAQEYLLSTHYQSTVAATPQPPSERQLRGWLDGTSNTRRLPNYHTMVRQCLNIPTAPRRIANVQICCPGCHTESTVDGLTHHAQGCARWGGVGSPVRRHDDAKHTLAKALRQHGVHAVVEAPIAPALKGEAQAAAIRDNLRMDLVVGSLWVDLTITADETTRFAAKQKKYGKAADVSGARLTVLAFGYNGSILPKSVKTAKLLAKMAGVPINALFTGVGAIIASHSALAASKAAAFATEAWHLGHLPAPRPSQPSSSSASSRAASPSPPAPSFSNSSATEPETQTPAETAQ
jgi:hypothetical protein